MEQNLKQVLGEYVFQICALQAQIAELQEQLKDQSKDETKL